MLGPLHIQEDVASILQTLQNNGHEALIVGGAVRDLLLQTEPKDYDIATSATPEEVKKLFKRRARIIGRRFRLVHVYCGRHYHEVSTFRREPSKDERRSRESDDGVVLWRDNAYGTLEQDAERRDFTVNAIYYDPFVKEGVRDFCGGVTDLNNRIVRAIGDPELRLSEDPVRMLRALKLVAQYDFRLHDELETQLRKNVARIEQTSRARRYEEMLKIFAKPYAGKTFKAFHDHGFLDHYIPRLATMWNTTTGNLTQALLQERDRRKAAETYSGSRTLAIATAALPAIAAELGVSLNDGIWSHTPGMESTVRDVLRGFFDPIPIPKVLTARARDLILLLPRFAEGGHKRRVLTHPEYRYSRELYSLLSTICGWDPGIIADWPEMGLGRPRRHRKPRGKHVKRSHRKKWDNE